MTAYNSLVRFWREYPVNAGGIHPKDRIPQDMTDAAAGLPEYIKSKRFLDDGTTIYSGLLPGPYCGDILNAKVYFLLLNPGFGPGDFHDESRPEFRKAAEQNLFQHKTKYPFTLLDPEFCWTGGAGWWRAKLAPLFDLYREKRFTPLETCKDLSGKIASLELFPYHSAGFGGGKLLKIESAALIQAFARSIAKDRAKLFVVMRKAREWGLGEGANIITFTPGESRRASIAKYREKIFRRLES